MLSSAWGWAAWRVERWVSVIQSRGDIRESKLHFKGLRVDHIRITDSWRSQKLYAFVQSLSRLATALVCIWRQTPTICSAERRHAAPKLPQSPVSRVFGVRMWWRWLVSTCSGSNGAATQDEESWSLGTIIMDLNGISSVVPSWIGYSKMYNFSKETSKTFRTNCFPLANALSDLYTATNNTRLVRNPKSGIEDYFRRQISRLGPPAHPSFTSGPLCRSKIFQRFQKSYLENQPMSLKMRKLTCVTFFPKFERDHVDLI